jgi:ppGpp synthetase/RelA/SpoT-type nucleotidyltranferase
MNREDFFRKYNISQQDFEAAGIPWDTLMDIYNDYSKKRATLETAARFIQETLRQGEKVHSIRYRTKDPEHLIEKLIRKKKVGANLQNYPSYINDLIGLRVLHLYKEDWESIHDLILSTWELAEEVTAHIRVGDSSDIIKSVKDRGCKIKEHYMGYRSIHYVIKSHPTNETIFAEIQVRTIFEEAWSELDHDVRYPYDIDNELLGSYLIMFNRLAGTADEMGSFIKHLADNLREQEQNYTSQIDSLKTRIKTLAEEGKDLDSVLNELDVLKGSFSLPHLHGNTGLRD